MDFQMVLVHTIWLLGSLLIQFKIRVTTDHVHEKHIDLDYVINVLLTVIQLATMLQNQMKIRSITEARYP